MNELEELWVNYEEIDPETEEFEVLTDAELIEIMTTLGID